MLSLALAAGALALVAAPAGASVLGPRAGHSPNADDIRTAYWVAIIVAALLIVVVHAFLIAALVRYRARRGRSPQRFTAGARAFVRPVVPLVAVAVGLFVFGIVMMSKARDVQATGPDGLNADADLLAQVNDLSIPPDRPPAQHQRDRAALALALRVPGRPAGRPDLLLRRADGARRHHGPPALHLDAT